MRDNPKLWVDDFNRKVLNLPVMGGCASLDQRETQKGFKVCRMTDHFILISGEHLVGQTKREASEPDPQHPMKQEITRFIMFCVPALRT